MDYFVQSSFLPDSPDHESHFIFNTKINDQIDFKSQFNFTNESYNSTRYCC